MPTPVALFVYNRVSHLRETIGSLQANPLAAATDLFIFCDGPCNSADRGEVDRVRSLVRRVRGFKSLTIREQEANLGLSQSIICGVSEVVNRFESAIILEDDMVSSPHFLTYMNAALIAYQHEERVVSIHGYCYPVKTRLPETFFLRGADCWGWGTWKRGWAHFNPDGRFLMEEIKRRNLVTDFNFNGTYDFFGMLSDSVRGRNDSWAIRWYASAFLKNKLTLYPGRSLIRNIGTDSSGRHCRNTRRLNVDLGQQPVCVGKIPVEENRLARSAFENFFSSLRWPLLMRLIHKLIPSRRRPFRRERLV